MSDGSKDKRPSLEGLIIPNRVTLAMIPWINAERPVEVALHAVEAGGVWIECERLTDRVLKGAHSTMLDHTPIFFVPFTQLIWIAHSVPNPCVSSSVEALAQN
jgi:hypothetical protein